VCGKKPNRKFFDEMGIEMPPDAREEESNVEYSYWLQELVGGKWEVCDPFISINRI
jgi:hypothetical protein